MIDVPDDIISPRAFPAIGILNNEEIVVMGGRDTFNFLGDVIIFNSKTSEVHKVFESSEDYLEFQAYGHQCIQIKKNTVVALVEDEERDLFLIQYTRGEGEGGGSECFKIFKGFNPNKIIPSIPPV